MKVIIPKKTILLLSGVSCIGKTTTAYKIIERCDGFKRVSELDLIKTVVKSVITNLSSEGYISKDKITSDFSALYELLPINDFKTAKLLSQTIVPYVKDIIIRQQQRNIATVIEGADIVPSSYFPNGKPLKWLNKNVIFINLYLANEDDHIKRKQMRCIEREYPETFDSIKNSTHEIREEKNTLLHHETLELSKKFNNVYSIDISNKSPDEIVDSILDLINNYYSSLNK